MATLNNVWKYIPKGDPDACWIWTAAVLPTGYGRITINKRSYAPHRLAYELAVGPIPVGLEIDHVCKNRLCCNPAHLEAVTHQENVRRSKDNITVAITASNKARGALVSECPNGHPYTEANTYIYTNKKGWTMRHCRECNRLSRQRRADRQRGISRQV